MPNQVRQKESDSTILPSFGLRLPEKFRDKNNQSVLAFTQHAVYKIICNIQTYILHCKNSGR